MMTSIRRGLPGLLGLALLLSVTAAACAGTQWPSAFTYSVGVSSDQTSRIQMSAAFSGPINESFDAKIGGWWVTGGEDNRAFLGDAYIDYHKQDVYVAGGRKFVPFGPAGVLVSPGIAGGEVQYNSDRVAVQAITGVLAFTPVTGGTRFTFAGNRSPADDHMTAGRVAFKLTEPDAERPVVVGVNTLRLLDHTGWSGDLSADLSKEWSLFGEGARFDDVSAHAYGVRWSDQKLQKDPSKYTMVVLYHRNVPIGFIPATVGATQYFENQEGWVGGIYHQLDARYGLGLYADKDNAILTLFGNVPLK
ncbi:MAG: hypothetical protein ABSD48_09870 [Armatimonadota bacterium]